MKRTVKNILEIVLFSWAQKQLGNEEDLYEDYFTQKKKCALGKIMVNIFSVRNLL